MQQFIKNLADKFFLRFHMSLILSLTLFSGFLSSRGLYSLGIENLTLRYSLSFLISYLCFFGLIRIWLAYIFSTRKDSNSWDWLDFDLWFNNSKKSASWKAGGGKFSGGGASGSFDKASTVETKTVAVVPLMDSSSKSLPDLDLDLDGDSAPLVVVLLVLAVIFIALGSAVYLVFNAPAVLGEIAFQLALSLGVLKNSNRQHNPFEWLNSAFKKTWIMATVVLILIIASTLTINHYKPEITKSQEIKEWIFSK